MLLFVDIMDALGTREMSSTRRLFTVCSPLQSLLNNFVPSHITRTPAWVKTTWLRTGNWTHAPSRTVGWHLWTERLSFKTLSQWRSRGGLQRPTPQQPGSRERTALHARLHVRTWSWFVEWVHESPSGGVSQYCSKSAFGKKKKKLGFKKIMPIYPEMIG